MWQAGRASGGCVFVGECLELHLAGGVGEGGDEAMLVAVVGIGEQGCV